MVHGIGASHGAYWEKTPTVAVKAEIEIQDPYLAVFHEDALKKKQDSADILVLPFQQPQVAMLAMAQTSVTPSGATSQSVTSSSSIQLTPGVNPFTGQPN